MSNDDIIWIHIQPSQLVWDQPSQWAHTFLVLFSFFTTRTSLPGTLLTHWQNSSFRGSTLTHTLFNAELFPAQCSMNWSQFQHIAWADGLSSIVAKSCAILFKTYKYCWRGSTSSHVKAQINPASLTQLL